MTLDDLRFAIQARLFAITHSLHQVVVSHNPPGNVKIEVSPELVRHVADIAKQLLPVGTGVEVSAI
jgi:hypothetical protein